MTHGISLGNPDYNFGTRALIRAASAKATAITISSGRGASAMHSVMVSIWSKDHRSSLCPNGTSSEAPAEAAAHAAAPPAAAPAPEKAQAKTPAKLSYKLKRELEALPEEIERLEGEVEARQAAVSDPAFFSRDRAEAEAALAALAELQATLEARIERWMELEALATGEG